METLEGFQRSRRVIEDFSSRTLSAISGDFAKLYYVSSLMDEQTGRYRHDGLTDLYTASAVQQALEQCHEELFLKVLETGLDKQERDLRTCLESAGTRIWKVIEEWRREQSFRMMCPNGMPAYLADLFCSNVNALLALYSQESATLALAS